MDIDLNNIYLYLKPLGIIAAAAAFGFLLYWIAAILVGRYARRSDAVVLKAIHEHLRRPARVFVPLVFALASVGFADFPDDLGPKVSKALEIFLYMAGAWLLVNITDVVSEVVRHNFQMDDTDNLEERKIITQMQFIKRLAGILVSLLAIAFILMQFEKVREIGAGLLTSAGIAGIVIGIAAQRPISNFLAGYQIAFTQPMRLDDVVIVEGEWGRIEEITMTYVVVRIWDERRLVLPLTYFIEKPFQNWTRKSADILGTVFLYSDYRLPIDAIRDELSRILEKTDLWDKRASGVQLTNASAEGIEVRVLVSASNASKAWDLRCLVREKLISFIQREYPECLPRTRVEMPKVPKSFALPSGDEKGHPANLLPDKEDTNP